MKLAVTLFIALSISACTTSSNESFNRKIEMQGEHNFRDFGEYEAENGKHIKKGMLYRSGSLHKLTDEDQQKLEEMGVKTVVNFLMPQEIEKMGEDKLPPNIQSVYLPIDGKGNEVDKLIEARETGNFEQISTDFNYSIHKILPETGKDAYAELFNVLADPTNYPIVFHCSHGIHRTGTASALIMSALNIPWGTVEEDYMLSSTYRHKESTARVNFLDSIARLNPEVENKEQNRADIEAFYFLKPAYIQGTQSHIMEEYGSFKNYFEEAGITTEQRKTIQSILLQ